MSHDTSKDPRLLVAEIAIKRLNRVLPLRHGIQPKLSKQQTAKSLKRIESALMSAKFMYLDPAELAEQEPVITIVENARALHSSIEEALSSETISPAVQAEARWCLQILEALPQRLVRQATSIVAGIDLLAVRVTNVIAKDKLCITRVDAGSRDLTVVTNMPDLRVGQVLGAALLPPVQLAGTVSEAMFLGNEQRAETPGSLLSERDVDAREAASILHEALSS